MTPFDINNLPPPEAWSLGRSTEELDAIRAEAEATGKTPDEVIKTHEWKKRLPDPRDQ